MVALHQDYIRKRFKENRWFLRCDRIPASRAHFLDRLAEVIGVGIKNPKDLTILRPFLSSREMIIVLDNAESILDPQGKNVREIREVVEELSGISTVCLCLTSRISAIPPTFKRLDIPTLSMRSARAVFRSHYMDYDYGLPDSFNNILEQLDFHPLSIISLATIAYRKNGTLID